MINKFGVAALGLLAASALPTTALAQCGNGLLIKFDADCYSYETNYVPYSSAVGSQLNVVGLVSLWCSPFQALNPADGPTKEYTFVWTSLTSVGTVTTFLGGGGAIYDTDYTGGVFRIYEGTPRNAAFNPNPLTTPPTGFTDGTLILEGTLSGFRTQVIRNTLGNFSGSFRSDYQFTGGSLYNLVAGTGTGLLQGQWCTSGAAADGQCTTPAGYTAQPNGKWDAPGITAVQPSTWGAIKQLYR